MRRGDICKRLLSGLLSCVMVVTGLPSTALIGQAHWDDSGDSKPTRVVTREQETVTVEDSWEETYPYGAFLFDNSDARVTEGGSETTIPLYRLGGTAGRATAYLVYAPAATELGDGRVSYGLAAGRDAVEILVEDDLPVARYQALGQDPDPDPSGVGILDEPYRGEDAQEKDHLLTIDGEADTWQWFILSEGFWERIDGAVEPEFIVNEELMEDVDFRCVFTKNGKSYSTDTWRGESYVKPEPEELPEMPDDLDLRPEQSFTPLEMDEENPYNARVIALTFADGEWKKEIRVRALEDDEAHPVRYGTFTILYNRGGDIFEPASVLTLQVEDNDEGGEYSIGFEETEVNADKAEGRATVKIVRRGGGQEPVTLDWSTVDGTALAGRDYESAEGMAVFYADVNEVTIDIPLIDDGVVSTEPLNFRLKLGELKGDSRGMCTVTDEYAEISLINSGISPDTADSGEERVMMGLFTADETEAAPEEPPVTGTQTIVPREDLLYGEIAGFGEGDGFTYGEGVPSDNESGEDIPPLSTYNYGEITFNGRHGGSYWEDRAYVAGKSDNDIPADWSRGSASGNGWKVKSDGDEKAELKIAHMPQMYQRFNGNFKFSFGWCSAWYISLGHAYGWAELIDGGASVPSSPRVWWDGLVRKSSYYKDGRINKSWDVDSGVKGIALRTTYHDHKSLDDVSSEITDGYLTRRVLDNNLRLRIHTANDGESGNGNVATAPKDGAALLEGSGVYRSMKPQVVIESGQGGVNSSGRLYVGSRVSVSCETTGSYKIYTGSDLNSAVYVTRSDGSRVDQAGVEVDKNGVGHVSMVWDGMTKDDIKDTYTINVVMTRKQELELNLRPSVDRKLDENGNPTEQIDPDRIGASWDNFWRSGQVYITLGVSEPIEKEPHFDKNSIKEIRVTKSDWESGDVNPLKSLGIYENIQYINFNRDKNDRIVFNKKTYKGNERINLATETLSFPKLSFLYYREEFLDKPNIMETSINRMELYLDGDGDGRIAGKYDESTGYFVLDSGTKDSFVKIMDKGSYDEGGFLPVELEDGSFGEYFAKVYYTMTPRYLEVPKGVTANGHAQVLPAFVTSRTDREKRAQITEEQKKYRYILPGTDNTGRRTSDDHLMYGEEATGMNYVDVPLGGDRSPLVQVDEGVYEWEPDYVGNLIYPFRDPEPIMIEHSLMGDNHPLVDVDPAATDAEKVQSAKNCINGYLGSYSADTDIALCVGEQVCSADQLQTLGAGSAQDADQLQALGAERIQGTPEDLKIENLSLVERTSAPSGDYNSEGWEGDGGETGMDTRGSDLPYDEMNIDYGVDIAVLKSSVQGLATVILGKNTISILISVPILSRKKSSTGEGAGEWKKSHFPQTITAPTVAQGEQISAFKDGMKGGNFDSLRNQLRSNGYSGEGSSSLKSSGVSISMTLSAILTLKYDTIDNSWYLQDFTLGIGGSFTYTYTLRLAVCPLIYFFFSVTAQATLTGGATIEHTVVEGEKPLISEGTARVLKKGERIEGLTTSYLNMYVKFKGKIYIEVRDSKNAKSASSNTNRGYLSSDGGDKVQVQFLKRADRMDFSSRRYIYIEALEDSTISYLNTIESVKSEMKFGGIRFSPKVTVEVGGGAGVEGLKAELFAKIIVSMTANFGGPEGGAYLEKASVSISLAVRLVFLLSSYEVDIVGWRGAYDGKTGTWKNYWTRFGNEEEIESAGASGGGGSSIRMSLPRDVSATQTIYTSQPESVKEAHDGGDGDEISSLEAYNANDPNVPFQLSGYNSSAEALRLADGLDLGYDYRVVEADGANYVVYTIGRLGGDGMDRSMLAVSRLVMTAEGNGADGTREQTQIGDGLGLANPLDWEEVTDGNGNVRRAVKAPNDRNDVPYILVDLEADESGTLVDDKTGDLDFDVKVFGDEIRVAWVSYKDPEPEPDSDVRKALQKAARNTVIKQASYDVTKKEGFSEALTISDAGWGDAVYQPSIINEDLTAFVRATHVNEAKREELLSRYTEKLKSLGYSPEVDEARKAIYDARMINYENTLDTKGESGTIYLYGVNEKKLFSVMSKHLSGKKAPIEPIDRLKGLELKSGSLDFVYLAYTTWKENDDSSVTEDYDSGLYIANVMHMRGQVRAYRERDLTADFSGELNPHSCFDALEIYDKGVSYEAIDGDDTALLVVGQGGKLYTLHFYINGTNMGFGTLDSTDFYGGSADTQRMSFAFGEDGAGNLATVYVGKVDGTTDTGLYLSRYDEKNSTWGKGVLLAMRHMSVHEEAVRSGWSKEDTDKAFRGELEGYSGGSMDQFQFDNPQIALGTKAAVQTGEGETTTSDAEPVNNTTLVIMTQGMMRYLEYRTTTQGERFLMSGATPPSDAAFPEGMGMYALSYGVGNQGIGDANISFLREDFSAGTELNADVKFLNTGDVSIRGSEDNPITVTLSAGGEGIPAAKLASWTITENIVPGREVSLSGNFTLPVTLPEGAGFTISISEDETYAEDPYSAALKDVYVVKGRVELGFEEARIELSRKDNGKLALDSEGNVIVDVDLFVGNRGDADAQDVRLQFAYGIHDPSIAAQVRDLKGEGSDWNDIIYDKLDITDNTLEVSDEEALAPLGAAREDLTDGVLSLGAIHAGYGRHVRGQITVSPECFKAFGLDGENNPAGSLKLLAEIYCGEGETDAFGVHHVGDDEYNRTNNCTEATIEHTLAFMVPSELMLSTGMMLRLPVNFSTTLGTTQPQLSAVEMTDKDDARRMLDIVSYERGSYKNGIGNGTVVIRGSAEGSSCVRIQDARTNAYQDITIKLLEPGEGLSISNAAGPFTFYDTSGKKCKTSGTDWRFGKSETGDRMISEGKPGTSFRFLTEAESIDLAFEGEVFVESDNGSFMRGTLTGNGLYEKSRFTFGENPDNMPHTVTITAKKAGREGYTRFYNLTEYYHGDDPDPGQPDIEDTEDFMTLQWDTNFPERGSLRKGQVFDMKLIVRSDCQIADSIVEGACGEIIESEKLTGYARAETIRFYKNGWFHIEEKDGKHRSKTISLDVDWWEDTPTDALESASPALAYYEKKYPDLASPALGADETEPEVVHNRWLNAEWDEAAGGIWASIGENAPMDEMEVVAVRLSRILTEDGPGDDIHPIQVKRGERTLLSTDEAGIYAVLAGVDKEGEDPSLDYEIVHEDGTVEKCNSGTISYFNYIFVDTEEPGTWTDPGITGVPVVQKLSEADAGGNRVLSFNSVSDGDTLYLLKGGRYVSETGMTLHPSAKGAVTQNTNTGKLTVRKDSLLVLRKGDEEKDVLLRTVTVKKKTVTLNSRKSSCTLAELFTGLGDLLPDSADGKLLVTVKKDANDILKTQEYIAPEGCYFTLDDYIVESTGKKGSATITAYFGGKAYNATVKCGGYPVLDSATGNIVANLPEADEAGNCVLTFDAVSDGDTLIVARGGRYALEAGVDMECADIQYRNAFKVTVNKKTGIRKLTWKKEAPVKLTRTVDGTEESKTILVNFVNIKRKNLTLAGEGDSLTLADLFTGGYEILPDVTGEEAYGGYRVNVTDRNGALDIRYESFPVSSEGDLSLDSFRIAHSGRKGSATVTVYFGGKAYKATVKCK